MTHDEIRAKVGAAFIAAEDRHEARTGGNWAEGRNAFFETVAEGYFTKEALREIYRETIKSWRLREADSADADYLAAYALLVAEASLYAKE